MIRNIFKAIAGFFGFNRAAKQAPQNQEYETPERAPKRASKVKWKGGACSRKRSKRVGYDHTRRW